MVLTDKEIRRFCNDKSNPLIHPFSEDALQSESYDVSIGNEITVFSKEVRCIDIRDSEPLKKLYKTTTLSDNGYVIYPKEYVLISLKETIKLPDNITAHIRPRTRFTRLGLIISDQHCNSTYSGKLNIGLYNATDNAIKIFPNIKIAQIVFEELKSIPSEEKQYKNKAFAAYQNEKDFKGYVVPPELQSKVDEAINFLLGKEI